jgi:sulfur relay (sulfurtransferase) complex TusBCD TusD component (DsrE family)
MLLPTFLSDKGGNTLGRYLLIETKGPLDGGDWAFELGRQLRDLDHQVTIYLLQDGVLTARRRFPAGERLLAQAEQSGLRVLADAVSARQRGVVGDRVAATVTVSDIGDLVETLMERTDKAIWH